MPKFLYEVRDPEGQVILGEGIAPTRADVIRELEKHEGYTILAVRLKPSYHTRLRRELEKLTQPGLVELAIFTRQLALMMHAGIPILKALLCLQEQRWGKRLAGPLVQVTEGVRTGKGLSNSMAKYPRAFGVVYVSLVRAGEVSGALDEILKRLADFLERDTRIYQKLKASLTYPILVFMASVAMVAFMVLHVFPAFMRFFSGLALQLPLLTRALLAVTELFSRPYVLAALLLLGPYLLSQLYLYFTTTVGGRRKWAWIILQTPVISKVQKDVILARFCRTLGIMIECGIPTLHALEVAGSVVGNALVQQEIQQVSARLRDGSASLSRELMQTSFFPSVSAHMLRVAEEAGRVPNILFKLADFYEAEMELSIQTALALLEPIMLTFMGALVGFILLAVFLPIYSLLDNL